MCEVDIVNQRNKICLEMIADVNVWHSCYISDVFYYKEPP